VTGGVAGTAGARELEKPNAPTKTENFGRPLGKTEGMRSQSVQPPNGARVSQNVKPSRTQPSLQPDATRKPNGVPEKGPKDPQNPAQIRQLEDIKLQNESAEVLSRAGYNVEFRHNSPITLSEVKSNPKLKEGKQPDYNIEGRVFDHLVAREGTSARNIITRSIQRDKIEAGQATRFVLNLEKSGISFEELRTQLTQYPVENLEEILVIKNGQVIPFFPFNEK
jgi:hypothetical protein